VKNCNRFRSELRDLPCVRSIADLSAEVRGHVESCPACRAQANERISLDRILDLAAEIDPDESFAARIHAAVATGSRPAQRGQQASPASYRTTMRRAGSIVLIAAGLVLTVTIIRDRSAIDTQAPGPDTALLAEIDLLLDWELLERHATELDIIAANDLMVAVDTIEDGS
jgi:hypothetical protein